MVLWLLGFVEGKETVIKVDGGCERVGVIVLVGMVTVVMASVSKVLEGATVWYDA